MLSAHAWSTSIGRRWRLSLGTTLVLSLACLGAGRMLAAPARAGWFFAAWGAIASACGVWLLVSEHRRGSSTRPIWFFILVWGAGAVGMASLRQPWPLPAAFWWTVVLTAAVAFLLEWPATAWACAGLLLWLAGFTLIPASGFAAAASHLGLVPEWVAAWALLTAVPGWGVFLWLARARHRQGAKARQADHWAGVGVMAAGLAHEINNPLAGLKLYVEMLQQGAGSPQKRAEMFGVLQDNIQRIDLLVRDFLCFAKQEKPRPEWVWLPEQVNLLLEAASRFQQFKKMTLVRDFDDGLPPVWVDAQPLTQVFLHAMNLARSALSVGDMEIRVRCLRNGGNVEIRWSSSRGLNLDPQTCRLSGSDPGRCSSPGGHFGCLAACGLARELNGRLEVVVGTGGRSELVFILPVGHGRPSAAPPTSHSRT